jgi:2-polyprenyl-6-methoxyphenol hydroxylase-like FAD-dependent oxidoreductase
MSDGRIYWYATENALEGARHADEKAALLQTFRGWHAPIEALIEATDGSAILRNDIYDRPVLRTWGEGRATLVGDAAHPMTPNLGQGACQALEDAVALAQCLREDSEVVSAARSYEARRIPRANAVVTQSRRVGRIGQWQHPVAVYLRDAIVSRIGPRLRPGSWSG